MDVFCAPALAEHDNNKIHGGSEHGATAAHGVSFCEGDHVEILW
jgi:hypothetical protein